MKDISRETVASVRGAQSHDSLGEIGEEPDRFARGDVGSSKGRRLHAARPVRESLPSGSGPYQRAMPHTGRDASGHRQCGGANKTYYWILAETGIRCGEACGLPARNLLLDTGAIKVDQKVWHGKIETVKSKKGNRLSEIFSQLAEHLRGFLRTWRPNRLGLLFATGNGTSWDADLVRKRKLYPLLEKLGIERCGFHAFRHGNETVMDGEGVPMATRQNRLGHSDARTTMRYTHVISDGRKIAARFGELLTCSPTAAIMPAGNE